MGAIQGHGGGEMLALAALSSHPMSVPAVLLTRVTVASHNTIQGHGGMMRSHPMLLAVLVTRGTVVLP